MWEIAWTVVDVAVDLLQLLLQRLVGRDVGKAPDARQTVGGHHGGDESLRQVRLRDGPAVEGLANR